jgi:serine/threonine protein kinase
MVLEWIPKGSLGDLLANPDVKLTWTDPLLRLAVDIARGMEYLHGKRYFDEMDKTYKECILHRDLKPVCLFRSLHRALPRLYPFILWLCDCS